MRIVTEVMTTAFAVLRPTAVLLSVAASVRQQGVNPWAYLRHALTELPARRADPDLAALLPEVWARSRGPVATAG